MKDLEVWGYLQCSKYGLAEIKHMVSASILSLKVKKGHLSGSTKNFVGVDSLDLSLHW